MSFNEKPKTSNQKRYYLALLAAVLLLSVPVWGNTLLLSAAIEGKRALRVQVLFPDGHPAQGLEVLAAPTAGGKTVTGRTDGEGMCLLENLQAGPYRVEVVDSQGRRAETKVVMPGAAAATATTSLPKVAAPAAAPAEEVKAATASQAEPFPWAIILASLGFVFGLGAFLMVLKLRADFKRYAETIVRINKLSK
jgi:hypothetical protein